MNFGHLVVAGPVLLGAHQNTRNLDAQRSVYISSDDLNLILKALNITLVIRDTGLMLKMLKR